MDIDPYLSSDRKRFRYSGGGTAIINVYSIQVVGEIIVKGKSSHFDARNYRTSVCHKIYIVGHRNASNFSPWKMKHVCVSV